MAMKIQEAPKASSIREILDKNPKTPVKEIVSTLAAKGTKVSENYAYMIKSKMKAKKRKIKRAKAIAASTSAGMPEQLTDLLKSVIERLAALAAGDAQLRSDLRALAQVFLVATEPPAQEVTEPATIQEANGQSDVMHLPSSFDVGEVVPPDLQKTVREAERPQVFLIPITEADFPLVEARCRVKAEAARWSVARQRMFREGFRFRNDIEPKQQELIAKANTLPDCYLWTLYLGGFEDRWIDNLAGCFDTAADAIALLRTVLADPPDTETVVQCVHLAAEAQSALMTATDYVSDKADSDQKRIWAWLRDWGEQRSTYIVRFMRREDRAEPDAWADVRSRIAAQEQRIHALRKRQKQQQKLLNNIRYKVKMISTNPKKDTQDDWRIIAASLDQLVRDGTPPSNIEIRELLLPVIEQVPGDLEENMPQGFQLVCREIGRYLESRPAAPEIEVAAQEPSVEVEEVARLLRGRSVVLIGGDPRPQAQRVLQSALGVSEVIWVGSREHQSPEPFEPYVARPDVAVVLLAIRWSSHSFGDVKEFCAKYGKPLVRLPGGYNPAQIASQILAQCSERLRVR